MMKHGLAYALVKTKSRQSLDVLEADITLMKQSSSKHNSIQVGKQNQGTWIKASTKPESRNTEAGKSGKRPCLRQIRIEANINHDSRMIIIEPHNDQNVCEGMPWML